MYPRHLLASCIAVVIAAASVTAAGSDTRLADSVRNRDKTNLRSLLKQRLDVNGPDAGHAPTSSGFGVAEPAISWFSDAEIRDATHAPTGSSPPASRYA